MDAGVTFRPQGGPAQTGLVRSDSLPVREAARTEISPAKAVVQPAESAQPKPAAQNGTTVDPSVNREVVFDQKTREVIFRVLDVSTGQVIRQIPEEALLKLRAYNREYSEKPTTENPKVEKIS